MSVKVKLRLTEYGLLEETDHDVRVELDLAIERETGVYCDDGVGRLTEARFRDLVKAAKERVRARRVRQEAGLDADAEEKALVEAAYA